MATTLIQKVKFSATPEEMYGVYMDSKRHSAAIGAKVSIVNKEGAKYSAHGGYITGRNLQLVKNQLIVQSWRASDWARADGDSTFILTFEKDKAGCLLTMVHANVPDKHAPGIKTGWNDYYWKPWKEYLKGRD